MIYFFILYFINLYFELNLKKNKCSFSKKYLNNNFLKNETSIRTTLQRNSLHKYLFRSFERLNENIELKDNTKIILLSDMDCSI